MTVTIEIDPESDKRTITAVTGGSIPVVVHDSVERMVDHMVVLRELHHGIDVDVLFCVNNE